MEAITIFIGYKYKYCLSLIRVNNPFLNSAVILHIGSKEINKKYLLSF